MNARNDPDAFALREPSFTFECDRRRLARLVRNAARLIGSSRAARTSSGAWVRVEPDRVTVTSTRPPVTLSQHLPLGTSGHGEVVVPIEHLRSLVLSRRTGTVALSGAAGHLQLDAGSFQGRILAMPTEWTVPPLPPVVPERVHGIGSYRFRDGLAHTALSVSHWRAWRPNAAGLEVSSDAGRLRFVATDLETLAIAEFPDPDDDGSLTTSIVVPAEALDALGRYLPPRRRVELRVTAGQVDVVAGDTEIRIEINEARFPDHRSLQAGTTTRRARLRGRDLRRAVERVSLLSHGNSPARVWLRFETDRVTARTVDRQVGFGAESVRAKMDGEPCTVGLHLWTLIAVLRSLQGPNVRVEIGDPQRRVTLFGEHHPERRYHMLPLALTEP